MMQWDDRSLWEALTQTNRIRSWRQHLCNMVLRCKNRWKIRVRHPETHAKDTVTRVSHITSEALCGCFWSVRQVRPSWWWRQSLGGQWTSCTSDQRFCTEACFVCRCYGTTQVFSTLSEIKAEKPLAQSISCRVDEKYKFLTQQQMNDTVTAEQGSIM